MEYEIVSPNSKSDIIYTNITKKKTYPQTRNMCEFFEIIERKIGF